MSSYFPLSILSANALEIAVLFFTGGIVILLRSLSTQDQFVRDQRLLIADLQLTMKEYERAQNHRDKELAELKEQCLNLHARQQLIEKHGSDSQRIDLAMRMLKRGNGDPETLHDLGLSSSEIKLLIRLHSVPDAQVKVANGSAVEHAASIPQPSETNGARRSARAGSPGESDSNAKPQPSAQVASPQAASPQAASPQAASPQVASQGARLAKLFKQTAA